MHTKYCLDNQEKEEQVVRQGTTKQDGNTFRFGLILVYKQLQNTRRSRTYLHNKERYQQFLNRNNFPVQH